MLVEQILHSVRYGLGSHVLNAPLSVRQLALPEKVTLFYSFVERSFM